MSKYSDYLAERYKNYIEQRRRLDSNALAIAEKYDQWVLTISGGALGVSLTFLEKISSSPISGSVPIIGVAWFCFVLSLLAGLYAIRFSSKSLVEQIVILDAEYDKFSRTTKPEAMLGDPVRSRKNQYRAKVLIASEISLWSLILGTVLLCVFSIVNLSANQKKNDVQKIQIDFANGLLDKIQNKSTNMSDKTPNSKGSYIPPRNETPPPPPPPERRPLMESYIPPTNEIPPPPPQKDE